MLMWLLTVVASLLAITGSVLAEDKFSVIHYFLNKPAQDPYPPLVADSAGNLYGTTVGSSPDGCGSLGCGAVFKLTRRSDGEWGYSILHRFKKGMLDGSNPWGSLIFDAQGNLYGTTADGGNFNFGTVFELSPSGRGWSEKNLYSFGPPSDISVPFGALIFDADGCLYGTASTGGVNYAGGVFKLKPSADNVWKETVIYSFTGGADGRGPGDTLVRDAAGNIYGTAGGGEYNNGLVFKLALSSGGTWSETILHTFTGRSDGGFPGTGVIIDETGNLYGATQTGGLHCGCGTVFELTPSNGNWTFATLHYFHEYVLANAGLLFSPPATLYGTTLAGGSNGVGLVFKLSQSGGAWRETVLQSFGMVHGAWPYAGLISVQGVLYGVTSRGGRKGGYGVVFRIQP